MFQKGDIVEWETQGGGSTKTRIGVVVATIPPGAIFGRSRIERFLTVRWLEDTYTTRISDGLRKRNGWSFLVAVRVGKDKAKMQLFWPRSSRLRLVKSAIQRVY